jgi:hypothetical protein
LRVRSSGDKVYLDVVLTTRLRKQSFHSSPKSAGQIVVFRRIRKELRAGV